MSAFVFWDNSNIWLVGKNVCQTKEPGSEVAFRVYFKNLFKYAVGNHDVAYAYVAGSVPPQSDGLWQYFQDIGVQVNTQERGVIGGGEVAVDEIIQLEMANILLDIDEPQTIILLTGDGNGYNSGRGFIKQLERAKRKAWNIEVVSWDLGCNRYLREFAMQNGVYKKLEDVYNQVTFIQNGRIVQPIF